MSLLRNGKLRGHLGSSLPSELNSDWDSYSIRRNSCSLTCCLSLWNFGILILIWFGSGVNIVFAVLGRMHLLPLSTSFTYTQIDPTIAVIGLEIITFLLAVVGFSALIRRKVNVLYLVCVLMSVLFVAHSGVSILIYTYIESSTSNIAQLAKQAVLTYTPTSARLVTGGHVNSLDYAQEKYGCCGAMSYTDWLSNPHYACSPPIGRNAHQLSYHAANNATQTLYCGVPMSCCLQPVLTLYTVSSQTTCGHNILTRTHNEIRKLIHTTGCYDAVWLEYRRSYLIISSISLTLGFILVLCLLITHTSIKEIQIANHKHEKEQKKRMQVHQIYNDL